MKTVKCLSVKQPWAGMIVIGVKTIEVRTWYTKYRGDLLIASSKRPANRGPSGMALALVELHQVVPFDLDSTDMIRRAGFAPLSECFAWELRNIRKVHDPFPVSGKLGIFNLQVDEKLFHGVAHG